MKTNWLARLFLAGALCCASAAAAQPTPPPAADGGYWNIETNLTTRDYTIVRFYNDQNQLVYEERLDNLCLSLNTSWALSRRLKQRLNEALQQVLHDPGVAAAHPAMLAQQLSASRRMLHAYRPAPHLDVAAVH